jgi:hypothetical protein
MKNNIIRSSLLILSIGWSSTLLAQSNPPKRDVLFLGGIGCTSSNWVKFYQNMALANYQLNALDPAGGGANYALGDDGVITSSNRVNEYLTTNNRASVLGIGHDGGGIVLREMAKAPSTKLSGIILDGVPNQGSFAIRQMTLENGGGTTTVVEDLVNNLESIRSATNTKCSSCNILGRLRDFSNCVKANSTRYDEYETGSTIIANLGTPTIPYAVIWGNANRDNYMLERLISSKGNQATGTYFDNDFTDCNRALMDKLQKIERRAEVDQVFTILSGFFKTLSSINSVFTVSASGEIDVDEAKLYQALGDLTSSIHQNIRAIRAVSDAAADVAECELIRQVINAHWNLIVSGGYTEQTTTTTVTIPADPATCCWSCYGEPDPDACIADCFSSSPSCAPTTQTTVTVSLLTQPSDGLYSKEEQLLGGAATTYEAVQTNHFQEQGWLNTQAYFRPLFDGQNIAFKVPKL